jgi:hypothetical protein
MLDRRPIRGLEGAFEVDRSGRIYTVAREAVRKDGDAYFVPARERRLVPAQNGYLQVVLSRSGVRVCRHVHRLVAEAFVDGQADGLEVNHRNGDKHDNRAENLEWVSRSENNTHKYRVLKQRHPMDGVRGAACAYSMAIEAVEPTTGSVVLQFAAMKEAQRAGYKAPAISRCIGSETRTHRGLRWRQANFPTTP